MKIREAQLKDLEQVIKLGKEFFEVSKYDSFFSFDEESFEETIGNLIYQDTTTLFVVDDDGIVGMAGAVLFPFYMNSKIKTCQEVFWYLKPEARKGRVGIDLLTAVEDWARNNGAYSFNMMSLEEVEPEKVERLLSIKGYKKTERHYMRIL